MKFEGISGAALVDTGSSFNAMSREFWNKIQGQMEFENPVRIPGRTKAAIRSAILVHDDVDLKTRIGGKDYNLTRKIVERLIVPIILGTKILEEAGISCKEKWIRLEENEVSLYDFDRLDQELPRCALVQASGVLDRIQGDWEVYKKQSKLERHHLAAQGKLVRKMPGLFDPEFKAGRLKISPVSLQFKEHPSGLTPRESRMKTLTQHELSIVQDWFRDAVKKGVIEKSTSGWRSYIFPVEKPAKMNERGE